MTFATPDVKVVQNTGYQCLWGKKTAQNAAHHQVSLPYIYIYIDLRMSVNLMVDLRDIEICASYNRQSN